MYSLFNSSSFTSETNMLHSPLPDPFSMLDPKTAIHDMGISPGAKSTESPLLQLDTDSWSMWSHPAVSSTVVWSDKKVPCTRNESTLSSASSSVKFHQYPSSSSLISSSSSLCHCSDRTLFDSSSSSAHCFEALPFSSSSSSSSSAHCFEALPFSSSWNDRNSYLSTHLIRSDQPAAQKSSPPLLSTYPMWSNAEYETTSPSNPSSVWSDTLSQSTSGIADLSLSSWSSSVWPDKSSQSASGIADLSLSSWSSLVRPYKSSQSVTGMRKSVSSYPDCSGHLPLSSQKKSISFSSSTATRVWSDNLPLSSIEDLVSLSSSTATRVWSDCLVSSTEFDSTSPSTISSKSSDLVWQYQDGHGTGMWQYQNGSGEGVWQYQNGPGQSTINTAARNPADAGSVIGCERKGRSFPSNSNCRPVVQAHAPWASSTQTAVQTTAMQTATAQLSTAQTYAIQTHAMRTSASQVVPALTVQALQAPCHVKRNHSHGQSKLMCVFCKNNGETPEFYTTHKLKDCWGRVICPVLRNFTCPNCGQSGDKAHTVRHCPSSKLEVQC